MKITVKMSADEFEEYRHYQQFQEHVNKEKDATITHLRTRCNDMADQINRAFGEREENSVHITNPEAAKKAFDMAVDWLC